MAIKAPKISKNAITILITLGIIGIVYVFYFFVYVHNNEISYQQRAFRELNKIGNNILAKHENNKKNATVIFRSYDEKSEIKSIKKSIKNTLDYLKTEIENHQKKLESLNAQLEFLNLKSTDRIKLNKKIRIEKDFIRDKQEKKKQVESALYNEDQTIYHYQKLLLDLNLNKSFNDLIEFDDGTDSNFKTPNEKGFLYYFDKSNISDLNNTWRIKTSITKFIGPMLRKDVFEELIIVRGIDQNIAFQTFKNKIWLTHIDSLYNKNAGVNTSKISTIKTEETNYKVFTYNLTFDSEEEWVIAGFISEDKYLTEIRSISFWIIINAVLFVILLMVGMPLLKLALMNAIERLHRYNVLLTGLSVILVTLLVVLALMITFNFRYDVNNTDKKLKKLSKEITKKFHDEISSNYKQLVSFESIILSDSILSKYYLNKSDRIKTYKDSAFATKSITKFNEVFWMNSTGRQNLQYTHNEKKRPLLLLKDRSYFQHVINDQLWNHPEINGSFYLQSLVSWTSGDHEIAVSKKGLNSNYPAAAITAKFKSVIDAILPMGYGFSIISPDGEVLIHSESDKNLQENFLEESENNANLRTAIYGAVELKTNLDYLGRKHRAHIIPMDGMPLYLIVYYDLENLKTKISEVWSMTLLFILASISAIVILLFIIFIVRFRRSKLKKKLFYFDWMLPQERYHMKYKKFILSNLVVILLIILFFKFGSAEDVNTIFKLFMLPSLLFVSIHYQLNHFISQEMNNKILSISLVYVIVINIIFYSSVGSWNFNELWPNILFQILIMSPFLLSSEKFSFWLKKTSKINLLTSIKNQVSKFDKWLETHSNFGNLKRTYSLFLSTWLLASAIIPAIFLYKTSYDIESEIWSKHTLLEMSRDIEKKFKKLDTEMALDIKISPDKEKASAKAEEFRRLIDTTNYSGLYYRFLDIDFHKKDTFPKDCQNPKFDAILMHLRPGYKDAIIQNKGLVYSSARDSSFQWKKLNNLIQLSHTLKDSENTTIMLSKKVDEIHFLSSFNWMSIFIILTLCIVFLYVIDQIISFCVNKIYGTDFYSFVKKIDKDDHFTKRIISENNTILIGLPGSGKTSCLLDLFEGTKGFYYIDCMTMNDKSAWKITMEKVKDEKLKTVVLDNFEYNNDDHAANSTKLRLLERLLHANLHVVIASEVHPSEIMDFYVNTIAEDSDTIPTTDYAVELEIWRHIFGNFLEAYKTLEKINLSCKNDGLNKEEKEIISEELGHGNSLQKICPLITEKIIAWKKLEETNHSSMGKKKEVYQNEELNYETKEDIILEIQQYAKSYYYALWNSLTKREQYAVYDIAKDGFMNTLNKPVIHSLLRKGLLQYDDKLRLMNESFTNFVLSVVTVRETIQMDREVSKKGKWVNIRMSIILVLIGLIALIGFGKPGFFENMNIIFIAITGVLSILPRLSNALALTQKIK